MYDDEDCMRILANYWGDATPVNMATILDEMLIQYDCFNTVEDEDTWTTLIASA